MKLYNVMRLSSAVNIDVSPNHISTKCSEILTFLKFSFGQVLKYLIDVQLMLHLKKKANIGWDENVKIS